MGDRIANTTDAGFETDVLGADMPLLGDFRAEWCGPCNMIAPILDEIAENYEGKIKVSKVDADANANSLLRLLHAGTLKAAERWTHPIQNWMQNLLDF